MKKAVVIFTLVLALSGAAQAQLVRDLPRQGVEDGTSAMLKPAGFFENLLGNAFDENHFQMRHSFSLNYNSFLGNTTGEYVNTMIYKFDIPLMIRADVGVMAQPFGVSAMQQQLGYNQSAFQGVYLKNVQAIYQPTKNMTFSVSFQQIPAGQMYWGNPYMNGYGTGGFGSMMRDNSWGW
jgi:hypothetical protein